MNRSILTRMIQKFQLTLLIFFYLIKPYINFDRPCFFTYERDFNEDIDSVKKDIELIKKMVA